MEPATACRVSIWRNRDFATFWVGETISQVGTQITFVALPMLAVLALDLGASEVGVLRFAEYLPFLATTLLFGVLADRNRRRPLMIVSNAVRAALVATVALCAVLDMLGFPLLLALALAIGTCAALFEVCWLSFVPNMVSHDRLVEAMSKVSASQSAAEIAGPSIGGVLVQLITAPFALVVDAVTYAAATVSLLMIRSQEPGPADGPRRRVVRELIEGLRFAFGEPCIRATTWAAALGNFFALITETVFLVYAVRELHLSPGVIGFTLSALGAGGLLGALSAVAITRRYPLGRVYVVARVVGGASVLLLPLAAGSTTIVVVTCMTSFFFWQAALANTNVINSSLRQALTPEHLRGRMNASVRTVVFGALPLGGLAGGMLGSALSLHGALWVGAIGYLLSIVPIVVSPLPRLRSLPG